MSLVWEYGVDVELVSLKKTYRLFLGIDDHERLIQAVFEVS